MVSLNFVQICVFGQGVVALLQGVLISQIITIILILLFEKRLRVYKRTVDRKEIQKEMLRYSVPLVPSALSWWVISASDRYVIRWILGSASNGIYAVAHKFPSILQIMFTMFNNAWTDLALAELGKARKARNIQQRFSNNYICFRLGWRSCLFPLLKLLHN